MDNKNIVSLHHFYNQKQGREYNQKEFAEKLGISASNLSLLESGKKRPSVGEAMAYRELLGVSLDHVFGYSDYPHPVKYEMGAMLDIAGNSGENAAVRAVNHLIGNYDCLWFFTLLDALWQTEPETKIDMEIFSKQASEMAACLIEAKTPSEAFPVRCKIERLLLEYIQSHRYEKPHEDNPDSEMDDILMDDLI